MLAAVPATAQELQTIAVPSGLEIALAEAMVDRGMPIARFRFVAPAIGGETGLTFADVSEDLGWLCDGVVVPALAQVGWEGAQVVLSVSDRPTEFGLYDPNVVQFFQPFRLTDGRCSWDEF